MRASVNLLAALGNSTWSALVGLAVVPFYLRYLGIEAYGLIGFFMSTQALLQFLDMGMAPTMNREVARCSALGKLGEAGGLLSTLAIVYWSMAVVIALVIFSAAPWISEYWLQSRQLPLETISNAVILIGLLVACRWPIGLYQGVLVGARRLTVVSGISVFMVTLGNVGAVLVLAHFSPTIEAFFIWQACVGLLHATLMRRAAWRMIGGVTQARFDFAKLRTVARFSGGMAVVGVTSVVFTQLDKLLLSKLVGLEEFGHYMLSVTIVNGLYVLIMPVFNTIYPRFSELVAIGETDRLANLYRAGTRLFAALLFPITMLLVVFAEELTLIWTGNSSLAASVAPLMALLAVGTALNGVMNFPYALQLAYGLTRLPVTINLWLMVVFVPLVVTLATRYGALGGAMAWLTLHVLYVILGAWLTHRELLKGMARGWLARDVGVPFLLSALAGAISFGLTQDQAHSPWIKLLMGVVMALVAFGFSILSSGAQTRSALRAGIRRNGAG